MSRLWSKHNARGESPLCRSGSTHSAEIALKARRPTGLDGNVDASAGLIGEVVVRGEGGVHAWARVNVADKELTEC